MSMENVKKFYELALKDEELKRELKRINERITVKQSDFVGIRKLVEEEILPLAKKRGLDFTADEIVSFANEQYTKLSEEDLLEVSGGLSTRNTAIGLSTVLLLSLGATSAINLLSHKDDLSQSISMSAPSETSENESPFNEEDNNSQDEAKTEKSQEKDSQNNSSEESLNNNFNNDIKETEEQNGNITDAEEAMAQGEEYMFGGMQDVFDQGRFDYEEEPMFGGMQDVFDQGRFEYEENVDQEDEESAFGGMKLFSADDEREAYKGQSLVGNMKSRETLVAQLADYLRSIDGDLNNVRESDQDKLKKDVQEAFGWIFEKGDGSGYGVQKIFGRTGHIEKADYDVINAFANKYDLTGDDAQEWKEAVVSEIEEIGYKAQGYTKSRATMVVDLANYLEKINSDINNVPEEDRESLKEDVIFLMKHLQYADNDKYEIKKVVGGYSAVDTTSAKRIIAFYEANYEPKGESQQGGSSEVSSAAKEEVAPADAIAEENEPAQQSNKVAYPYRYGQNTNLKLDDIRNVLKFWKDLGTNRSIDIIKDSDKGFFIDDMLKCTFQAYDLGGRTFNDYGYSLPEEDLLRMDLAFREDQHDNSSPSEKVTKEDIQLMKEFIQKHLQLTHK